MNADAFHNRASISFSFRQLASVSMRMRLNVRVRTTKSSMWFTNDSNYKITLWSDWLTIGLRFMRARERSCRFEFNVENNIYNVCARASLRIHETKLSTLFVSIHTQSVARMAETANQNEKKWKINEKKNTSDFHLENFSIFNSSSISHRSRGMVWRWRCQIWLRLTEFILSISLPNITPSLHRECSRHISSHLSVSIDMNPCDCDR